MKTSTAHNHYTRLASRMDSIYSAARSYGSKHATILDELKKYVYDDDGYNKSPRWVRSRLTERSQMRLNEIHMYHVVFMFETLLGAIVPWNELTEEDSAPYLKEKMGKHYWLLPVYEGGRTTKIKNQMAIRNYKITNKEF